MARTENTVYVCDQCGIRAEIAREKEPIGRPAYPLSAMPDGWKLVELSVGAISEEWDFCSFECASGRIKHTLIAAFKS